MGYKLNSTEPYIDENGNEHTPSNEEVYQLDLYFHCVIDSDVFNKIKNGTPVLLVDAYSGGHEFFSTKGEVIKTCTVDITTSYIGNPEGRLDEVVNMTHGLAYGGYEFSSEPYENFELIDTSMYSVYEFLMGSKRPMYVNIMLN